MTCFFFPNSFSYGVFANIGSGAVPGRLPNHGFREGSGAVFQVRAGFQRGSGRVPGQVPGHCFRNRVWKVLGQGRVPRRFRRVSIREVPGQVPGRVPILCVGSFVLAV